MGSCYSPVGPIRVLEYLEEQGLLGDYVLVLAHEVLDAPERYAALLRDKGKYVILDNSVIELGKSIPAQYILEAAKAVEADVVILPDVLGDTGKTVEASAIGAERLRDGGWNGELMAVPQGRNFPEITWCAQQVSLHVNPDCWGIPRWVANTLGTRWHLVQCIAGGPKPPQKIHLLGMSNHLTDDIRCARHSAVMGIDSANPLIMGLKGAQIDNPMHFEHVQGEWKDHYWKTPPIEQMAGSYLRPNIQRVREQINQ